MNLFWGQGMEKLRRKLNFLKRHCDEVDRPYDEIEKTALGTVHPAPGAQASGEVIELFRNLATEGILHAIFNMPEVHEIGPLQFFGREIITESAGL